MAPRTRTKKVVRQAEGLVTPTAPVAAEKPKWYMCPICRSAGEVLRTKNDLTPLRKVLDGVVTLKSKLCPMCRGFGMVQSESGRYQDRPLYPIKLCDQCRNWYAFGGGEPPEEPCPRCMQNRHVSGAHGDHCHWHDRSMHPPARIEEAMRQRKAMQEARALAGVTV